MIKGLVRARGTSPYDIESIDGDCAAQTVQQIADLERWLAAH